MCDCVCYQGAHNGVCRGHMPPQWPLRMVSTGNTYLLDVTAVIDNFNGSSTFKMMTTNKQVVITLTGRQVGSLQSKILRTPLGAQIIIATRGDL